MPVSATTRTSAPARAILRPRSRRSPVGPTDFTPCSKRWASRGRTWSSGIHSVAARPSPSPRCLPMRLSVWCWSTPPRSECPTPFALPSLTALRAWTRTTIRNESTLPGRSPRSPPSTRSVRCRSWSSPQRPMSISTWRDSVSMPRAQRTLRLSGSKVNGLGPNCRHAGSSSSSRTAATSSTSTSPPSCSTTSGLCSIPRQHHRPRRH